MELGAGMEVVAAESKSTLQFSSLTSGHLEDDGVALTPIVTSNVFQLLWVSSIEAILNFVFISAVDSRS